MLKDRGFFDRDVASEHAGKLRLRIAAARAQVVEEVAQECDRELGPPFGQLVRLLLGEADRRIAEAVKGAIRHDNV